MATVANPKPRYNFDMKVLLKNLIAYHPYEAHTNIEIDQDLDTELEHISTYVSMKDHSIITDTIPGGRKWNFSGDFALVVETKEDPCKKIKSLNKQHAIVTNDVALMEDITS